MYFVPDGTQVCGFYECESCGMRYLSLTIAPSMVCPYCDEEVDMEIPEIVEHGKLIKTVAGEEIEKMDALLNLAITGGDYDWI